MPLQILFASVEVEPFAKVGGLADVAGSLPKALNAQGHDCRIFMPAYRFVEEDPKWGFQTTIAEFTVEVGPGLTKIAYVKEALHDGVTVYLVGTDQWFTEATDSTTVYLPGKEQYMFFAQAVLKACGMLEWQPDVVHANDWHAALIPVLMREGVHAPLWSETASIFTIHNLAYQGEFEPSTVPELGLDWSLFNMDQLETYGMFNFLKAGMVYADQVNTVSKNYAKEIQTPEFGCQLEGLMVHLANQNKLSGIVNGIDTERWDPATDPHLPAHYSADDLRGKAKCRKALAKLCGFPNDLDAPIVAAVTRLSNQKGMDLLLAILDDVQDLPMRIVVQGLGDPWLAEQFRAAQKRRPESFRFFEAFDATLAQKVYGGADMFLMPSAFEPCGLGQLFAMRYGTVPIVRSTGGLVDTVHEGVNGFAFKESSPNALFDALKRAAEAYREGDLYRRIQLAGMQEDNSWTKRAESYVELYEKAILSRQRVGEKRTA
ncbi:MAG: glycogen synthase [Fimbriimonadaceae bacterium]|nr:glycogen synthase [Fimbriimonadaceae bacterium]